MRKRNKYNSYRPISDNGRNSFDSRMEGRLYRDLEELEKIGEIVNLMRCAQGINSIVISKGFEVTATTTARKVSKIKDITYTPDFFFITGDKGVKLPGGEISPGKRCYIEAKSTATAKIRDYFPRKHLFLKYCIENDLVDWSTAGRNFRYAMV